MDKLNKKTGLALFLIFFLFLALRLPGIFLPYHQDEFKNVIAAETAVTAGEFFAHPPLMQLWFVAGENMFGGDLFRLWPILWSIATFFLLFAVVKRRAGDMAGLASVFLFSLSFFGAWGSLMADVDGSALVFLFIATVYVYDKWREAVAGSVPAGVGGNKKQWYWFVLLVVVMALGFLVKLSFIIVVGAILLDLLLDGSKKELGKRFLRGIFLAVGFGALSAVGLYLFSVLYPHFDIRFMLSHAGESGAGGSGGSGFFDRNWGQIIFQKLKAVFYLSPMLFVPILFLKRESFAKVRIFLVYLILGAFFYLVLFDFSQAALDKYLVFTVVPLVVLSGVATAFVFGGEDKKMLRRVFIAFIISTIIAGVLIALCYISQAVVPLHPKSLWVSRVAQFDWNVLTPFNGGSGPVGFYISFLFIAVSFIGSIVVGVVGFFKKNLRREALVCILVIGLAYNIVFIEELFYGKLYGNPTVLVREAISFISMNPDIKSVTTFNDIGAYELSKMGKYEGRFYAAPQFEEGHKQRFASIAKNGGAFLVIELPIIYKGFYTDFFAKCDVLWNSQKGSVPAHIYDCSR